MGSGLNAGNIGAEIDVIKPALPTQTHAPIAIHLAFGISRSFITLLIIFFLCEVHAPQEFPIALEGPGWSTPEEALKVLEKGVLPTFDILLKLEAEKRIVAGGLPVGERKLIFILEASSNEEVDQVLRDIPLWGVLKWEVIPLESFEGRAQKERSVLSELKKQLSNA